MQPQIINESKIFEVVCSYFNKSISDIKKKKGRGHLYVPRKFAIYLLYIECHYSYNSIAAIFGHKDHTTALHHVHTMHRTLRINKDYKSIYNELNILLNK